MIHNLAEKLKTMHDKNVDITLANESNAVLVSLSTEQFASEKDEFHLILNNNCHDCNFDFHIPLVYISTVNLKDFEAEGTIVIVMKSGLQYIINKI